MKKLVLEELEKIVGKENMSAKTADLYVYGFDASIHHKDPDVVVRPADTQQISEIVKLANRTGASVEGELVTVGGVEDGMGSDDEETRLFALRAFMRLNGLSHVQTNLGLFQEAGQ